MLERKKEKRKRKERIAYTFLVFLHFFLFPFSFFLPSTPPSSLHRPLSPQTAAFPHGPSSLLPRSPAQNRCSSPWKGAANPSRRSCATSFPRKFPASARRPRASPSPWHPATPSSSGRAT